MELKKITSDFFPKKLVVARIPDIGKEKRVVIPKAKKETLSESKIIS